MDAHLTQSLETLGSATMSFVTQDRSEGHRLSHFQFICYMHRTNTTTITFNDSFFFYLGTVIISVPST